MIKLVVSFLFLVQMCEPKYKNPITIIYQDNSKEVLESDTNLTYELNPYGCLEIINDSVNISLRCGVKKVELKR